MTTMMLEDNGAEVTRIAPPQGDPFEEQSGYVVWHRGADRIPLDLQDSGAIESFHEMVRTADIVVSAFSPEATEHLGIDHPSLAELNPRVISCAISGYGRHPKHKDRPGYDALVSARTGLFFDQRGRIGTAMNYIGHLEPPSPDFGPPEGMVRGVDRPGPIFPRSNWPSVGAAHLAIFGIAAALRAREVTGKGQAVETSLFQGALFAASLTWQRVERPDDSPLYWMWPTDSRSIEGLFECADGRWVHHWSIWPAWVRDTGSDSLATATGPDSDYRGGSDRIGMTAEDLLVTHFLYPELAEAFKRLPARDWVAEAEANEMGIALVRSPLEALLDESFLADGCVMESVHPRHGRIRHIGNPLEFGKPYAVSAPTRPSGASELSGGPLAGGPLAGIKVLDLGLGVAGPFGPRMLADLGADVIKVHAIHDTFWAGTHMGLGTNRGKRSISVNLKDPRGLEILHQLIDQTDVIATNWRPGAMARLGIDEESLRDRRPDLVICNSRGFEKGPRSDLPGTDQTAAALCGTEWEDGACSQGNPPLWSRSGMGDTGNAMLSATAIALALFDRERTGVGRSVSTSIVNATLLATSYAWIDPDDPAVTWDQVDADQWGLNALYRMYQANNGFITIAVVDESAWLALTTVEGLGHLANDERFADGPARAQNDQALSDEVALWIRERSADEAFKLLDSSGVPVEIVNEEFCREFFDDPEALALELRAQTASMSVGLFEDVGHLVNFSDTKEAVQRGPCECGEHTAEILTELGFASDQIDALAADRVVLVANGTT
jgi:crotonobetainyl-CoA:carnitine CoA-transferase CaiB-like acyl-CoA transferase